MEHHHSDHLHFLMGVSPLEFGGFISVLSYSFFASLHCAFMCTPLVCAVIGNQCRPDKPGIWIYNIGRVLSYIIAGSALGGIGASLKLLDSRLSQLISVAAGCMVIYWALRPWIGPKAAKTAGSAIGPFAGRISKFIASAPTPLRSGILGIGTVFLPCMTLTPALTMALGMGDMTAGGMLMLGFALGTLPMMLLSPALAQGIVSQVKGRIGEMIATGFLIIAGLITILRAFH